MTVAAHGRPFFSLGGRRMLGLKAVLRWALHSVGLDVVTYRRLLQLEVSERAAADIEFLRSLPEESLFQALAALPYSQSQMRQDLFALSECAFRRAGFFVEFGATDGKAISNSWLLEKKYGWNGILAEPGRCWHDQLKNERTAKLDFDCVWNKTGEILDFAEAMDARLSTLTSHASADAHASARRRSENYKVRTISLNDLLIRHDAPNHIDYLSIDTEGTEYEILSALDFDRFRFSVITCEHNFTPNRDRIHSLLTANGYRRKSEEVSHCDDWYILAN